MTITRNGCQWSRDSDEDSDTWSTACSHYFTLIDGTPTDNGLKYCCYCGRPLIEVPWEAEE
jgi:hypothetical protein